MEADKRDIRRAVLRVRDGLEREERERASLLLTERILGHQWFYGSTYFLGFASYGSEIDTWEILREALRLGKKVYVPKVIRDDVPRMEFYRIGGPEDLQEGYKGIWEPSGSGEEYIYTERIAEHTLMLMPGVAFDGYRNRIGYGKGFYDRFLADKEGLRMRTVAVGYRCQMVDEVPVSESDVKPCQVICV